MDLAELTHAEVLLVHAAEQPIDVIEPVTEEETGARRVVDEETLAALAQEGERRGIRVHRKIREGNPVQILLDAASQTQADLIVVGTRGLRGTAKILLGSVSSGVVAGAKAPVTVLH
jgi:nucleotide-binding universal stress UspA family protein